MAFSKGDLMRHSFILAIVSTALCSVLHGATVIDHTCADLDLIPASWIIAVQDEIPSHYAHTSHGSQLTYGLEFIEAVSSFYSFELGYRNLPSVAGAWCIFQGQESVSYITPDLYWETSTGMNLTRDVLDHNPTIKTSMWCWCCQMDGYSESQVQAYLDSMSVLEAEYPNVTFIYFTGNAQGTGSGGYNRWQRNEQVRSFCNTNDKVLYDFADLDCWWYNPSSSSWEQHTYYYSGYDIPAEHPQFYGNQHGHTTDESCYQKGEALWYMMAIIAGWTGTGIAEEEILDDSGFHISAVNPSRGTAGISCSIPQRLNVSISVYSCSGRLVDTPFRGELETGNHEFVLDALPPGLYHVVVQSDEFTASESIIILN